MKLDVIIPIGPGHESVVNRAISSVHIANQDNRTLFESVRVIKVNDTEGKRGRAAARNEGVHKSDADWLLMHSEAFRNATHALAHNDAIFGQIVELVDSNIVPRYQVPEIITYDELILYPAYMTLQMGHFVKRESAVKLPFDEDMNTGEDWDYYLRLWFFNACVKLRTPLMINDRTQHSTGPRSATGAEWDAVVTPMLEEARKAQEPVIQVAS